jgi:phage protein U
MSEVLMTLGTVRFSIQEGAYKELTRTLEIRVARQDRAGRKSSRQVLGEDETIEISGTVYPAFRGGLARLDSFRELARTYKPQMLTDGLGRVWGRFVVEGVDEAAGAFLSNGAPQRQDFRIRLGAYGDDA